MQMVLPDMFDLNRSLNKSVKKTLCVLLFSPSTYREVAVDEPSRKPTWKGDPSGNPPSPQGLPRTLARVEP